MSRKIKFRAWLKNKFYKEEHDGQITLCKPKMVYQVYLSPDGHWLNINEHNEIDSEDSDISIMQSTGCYDSKNHEVYEDDILLVDWENDKVQCVVVWKEGELKIQFISNNKDFFVFNNLTMNHEVIGNIYENPELIKEVENHG